MNINQEQLNNYFQKLTGAFNETISSPKADPQQTLIVGGVIIVVVAILALIVISLYPRIVTLVTGKKKDKKTVVPKKKMPPLTNSQKLKLFTAVSLFFLVSVLSSFMYIESSSFCSICHVEKNPSISWEKSTHNSIGCFGCHRSPGFSGYLGQKVDYFRWIWRFSLDQYRVPVVAIVNNSTCTRCHTNDISEVVVSRGIRVRHIDFINNGSRCTDCHNTIGHKVNFSKFPSMAYCIDCHNNQKVSAKCTMCHTDETPGSPRKTRDVLPVDVPAFKNCRGCHKQNKQSVCIRCHGLEMPHPEGWREGSHAKIAFLNKDKICFRCHEASVFKTQPPPFPHGGGAVTDIFCNKCHSFPSPHGSSTSWAKLHGPVAFRKIRVTLPVCADCHKKDAALRLPNCAACHTESDFCDRCHPIGKYDISILSGGQINN